MNDKRGITFNLFYFMVWIFVGIILLAVVGFVVHAIRGGLNVNEMAGQVNLSNVSESTLGVVDDSLNSSLDLWGLFLIFGMIGGLLIASFMLRGQWNKLLIVVDLLIMIVVYIASVLIANSYEHLLIASSGIINQFEGSMPKTSNFILHLPRYVVIIGGICMILFYSAIPKREDERTPIQSYQDGGGY